MLKHLAANLNTEFPTRERCSIVELLNEPEIEDLSIARCRVEPGVTTELHSLDRTREVYVVTSGSGIMDDGQKKGRRVGAMDCVVIPAGHPQRITNDRDEDLIFLAICTRRFVPECYVAHEGKGAVQPKYTSQKDIDQGECGGS